LFNSFIKAVLLIILHYTENLNKMEPIPLDSKRGKKVKTNSSEEHNPFISESNSHWKEVRLCDKSLCKRSYHTAVVFDKQYYFFQRKTSNHDLQLLLELRRNFDSN